MESYGRAGGMFAQHRLRVAPARLGPRLPDRQAFMLNQLFLWGHRWIYDLDELRYALASAGFDRDAVAERSYRKGGRADVAGLDQRFSQRRDHLRRGDGLTPAWR